jgi:threonine dehydrogenase-like Zn-dependent dehydrogenase
MHLGTCSDVGGGFAEAMSVHESMLFPIPESVPFDAAVLADPFEFLSMRFCVRRRSRVRR